MILKGLKRNAIKKSAEAYLKERETRSQNISNLKTLAVLIDATQSINIVSLLKLANELGVKSEELKVIGYKEDQKEIIDDKDAAYYNDKSFGVNGAIKSKSLQDFVDKDFDVLINFYEKNSVELNYVAAASKAKFKVGFAEVDNRINDLIIGSTTNDTNLFISELKKYLKILQII
ncbi:hypothetical protein IWQ47_003976 [Aquimarina sp. EL_43]|jgi:hypothetical protein|uniref:DUF6913 domain-containing protein n=1 Tax=Aquimarina TaxID=290174 RepID=UPI0004B95725|nr:MULTISPECIES: hypothetical protein [Aquimarina]MBG6132085.1 hypothetical protein [Aquimarina sp. EL_35]MBG6152882.1 hypothetical protein [Aquimarina sp. EL_32]MBG6170889.1 hypothetical protein [Aquimarina sp. EL_43]